MAFSFRKHYFDVVDDAGRVRILYLAELCWRRLVLRHFSVLRDDGAGPSWSGASFDGDEPSSTEGTVACVSQRLGVDYRIERTLAGPRRILLETAEGALEWNCHTLRGRARVRDRGEEIVGDGYAETLETSVAPWDLPWRSLHWGRLHDPDRALVWTVLEGPEAPPAIFAASSEPTAAGRVDDRGVTLDSGERIDFLEPRVLRSGRIGETVLSRVPGLERLPGRILGLSEVKHVARTALGGNLIYERVEWPAAV